MFIELRDLKPIEFNYKYTSFITSVYPDNRIDLMYFFNAGTSHAFAQVVYGKECQGPPGHAHGGAIMAVFDELMGATSIFNKQLAVTAEMKTEFIKPLPLGKSVLFESQIIHKDGVKLTLKSFVKDNDNTMYSSAEGLFIILDVERFREFGADMLSELHSWIDFSKE